MAEDLLERIIREGWSARRIEQWISQHKRAEKMGKHVTVHESVHNATVEYLSNRFKTPVTVSTNMKGVGKIVIPFKNEKEFARIRKMLE